VKNLSTLDLGLSHGIANVILFIVVPNVWIHGL
jgi:hypothetical protein